MNSVKSSAYYKCRLNSNKKVYHENKPKIISLINDLIGKGNDLNAIIQNVSCALKRTVSERELERIYNRVSGGYLYTELEWAIAIKKEYKVTPNEYIENMKLKLMRLKL